ncbi:MAG: Rrf2 family transcriptional regulator [Burkholderiales bacterium]
MKLQTATSLALVSVLEAAARPERQVSAADIAQKYGVSIHHLAKVLRELGRAGIVEATRGAGGGYRFVGNARRLTLYDVIEQFEDIGARSPEAGGADPATEVGHALARVLAEIDEIAKATFRSITIDTMLKLIERERVAQPHAA